MNDTTYFIIVFVVTVWPLLLWPFWLMYKRFRKNRDREQKKPEKYHFT